MGSLQDVLDRTLKRAPEILLRSVIDAKLARTGINIKDDIIQALMLHILEKRDGSFTWNNEPEDGVEDLTLSFDEDDYRELNALSEGMSSRLKKLPLDLTKSIAKSIFDNLVVNWNNEKTIQIQEQEGFRSRIDELWGKSLDLLKMFLTSARELINIIVSRTDHSTIKTTKLLVLTRLYARGCQVTEEIIVLLENGFADGAMARWRTLHEISVVSLFISENDEELSQRYHDHDIVEVKRLSEKYLIDHIELGFRKISDKETENINQRYSLALERYGEDFRHQYGWAAKNLGIKKPNFSQIQKAAGRSAMSSYYHFASDNVHAGSRGTFIRMSAMGKSDVIIAGRSNAGLLEPGQNTVYSMTQIVASLFGKPNNLDEMVEMSVIIELRESTKIAFLEASEALKERIRVFELTDTE